MKIIIIFSLAIAGFLGVIGGIVFEDSSTYIVGQIQISTAILLGYSGDKQ